MFNLLRNVFFGKVGASSNVIKGAKYWNDNAKYYIQTNNPTEETLRKRTVPGFLESCGPTSAINCISAMGYNLSIKCPGVYEPQPEEILMDYFNDPRNYDKLTAARPGTPAKDWLGNEIPQFYPVAIKDVFGVDCKFDWISDFNKIAEFLKSGKAVQLCLKTPGHYVAAVAYNETSKEIIINDPWPGRFADGNGFNKIITFDEYSKNVNAFVIIYGIK
jgi:hypothetical protein